MNHLFSTKIKEKREDVNGYYCPDDCQYTCTGGCTGSCTGSCTGGCKGGLFEYGR